MSVGRFDAASPATSGVLSLVVGGFPLEALLCSSGLGLQGPDRLKSARQSHIISFGGWVEAPCRLWYVAAARAS